MQGKELSWHQVPCPRDPMLLWIELYPGQAGRGAMASVQMWHYLGHVTWSQCGPSVVCPYWSWRVIPSPRLAASPLSSYSLPAGAVTHQAAATPPHLGTQPRPTPPPHRPQPPRPRPGLLYPAPRPGPSSAGLQCHQARLGRGFSEKVFISTAPCRAAPRQHQLSRTAATATCNKYTATSHQQQEHWAAPHTFTRGHPAISSALVVSFLLLIWK